MISFTSAFLDVKNFNPNSEKYGEIQIYDWLFLNKADYKLTDYDSSIINVWAEGDYNLHKETHLFTGMFYKDVIGNKGDFKDVKYFIWENSSRTEYDIEYEDCQEYSKNTTKKCENEIISNKSYQVDTSRWIPYQKGMKLPRGSGKWRFEAEKPKNKKIDFILEAHSKEFDEWAWFNTTFPYKRELSNLTGNITYIEINYSSNMQSDFDDIRFVNTAGDTEYSYYLQEKVDSTSAIFRVLSLEATEIDMYYGNTDVTTTSSLSDIYGSDISLLMFMDETSGTNVKDVTDNSNGTTENSPPWVDGIAGNALDFDGVNQRMTFPGAASFAFGDEDFSYGIFFKTDYGSFSAASTFFGNYWGEAEFLGLNFDGNNVCYRSRDSNDVFIDRCTVGGSYNDDEWHSLFFTRDTSANLIKFYVDGLYIGQDADTRTGDFTTSSNKHTIGGRYTSQYWNIIEDEAMIYGRVLTPTEIGYFSGTIEPNYVVGSEQADNTLSVESILPVAYYNSTANDISFECEGTDETGLYTLNLTINGTVYESVTGAGNTNLSLSSTETLSDGYWEWYCTGNDDITSRSSSVRYLTIDSTLPTIEIESPNGTYGIISIGDNVTLNVTITDDNLESCWYNYNGTNITIDGCLTVVKNSTTFILEDGNTNMTIYANDTFGNLNSTFSDWNYKILEDDILYNSSITEGELTSFSVDAIVADGSSLTSAIFNYNNTNYTTSIDFSGGTYSLSSSISAPIVPSDTNITFSFFVVVDGVTYQFSENNQTVLDIAFSVCGGASSNLLLNMSLIDEIIGGNITGDIQINAQIISKTSGDTVESLNSTFSSVESGSICFTPTASFPLYYLDAEIRYVSDGYAPELYIIQKSDMEDYPINLNLYDLNLSSSTEFLLKYQDNNLIAVEGAVIQLLRKYIGEDAYKVVEAPLTSSLGTAILHIDLNTNLYKAIIVKDGIILDTFTNLVFDCENELSGQCTQNLLGAVDPQNSAETSNLIDFSYSISSINNTITTVFSVPSGKPSTINIFMSQADSFGTTTLCNTTVVSSGGSIDCDYNETIGDSKVYLIISKDGEIYVNRGFFIEENIDLGFANNNYLIVLLLLLTLVGMAFSSPEWIVIIGIVALIISSGLWLIKGMNLVMGLGMVIFLVGAAAILIMKMTKQEDR